ncbi:hypothetical protein [Halopelagius longus]|uniref:DUF7998 domain-containing protein n=1 Tax=Halopelagius longus TaxID=1236180 RepID=A0A1H1FJG2_9EURY|nr:hypothetical protein [Halopelagius longus]RDI70067.1 hypothetical protein DWB78_15680 [Halopelagius longus]SDR01182.1 hypothetical protein SAMN05216278_3251 [Halopelagius longus]
MFGFGSASSESDGAFDGIDEFVPEHIPEPGPSLEGHDVLRGEEHVAFHRTTEDVFEERGVYDVTFGYNLARLNLDHRHPDSGYRYAVDEDDPSVLRAEFTPTAPFCPQSRTLTVASFRAWNGLAKRHDYELVRVSVHPMHHRSDAIDDELDRLASEFRESGELPDPSDDGAPFPTDGGAVGGESDAPF